MVIVQATLTKLATDDGLVSFEAGIAIGRTYLVDVDSIRRGQSLVLILPDGTCTPHVKDIVFVVDGVGWLPLECLSLEA